MICAMRGVRRSDRAAKMPGSSARRKRSFLTNGDATLQQKGSNLIDSAGALTDQPLSDTAQGLEVELLDSLRRHKLHRWASSMPIRQGGMFARRT